MRRGVLPSRIESKTTRKVSSLCAEVIEQTGHIDTDRAALNPRSSE